MEEVVDNIQIESPAKVVEESIIRERPYKPEDMVVEDIVMPKPSNLGFVALKRAATSPVTLGEMPLKVTKIEIEVGKPSTLCQWWDSKQVPIDVIVIDSNSDDDAPVPIIESRFSGATTEMELKPSIQMQVETYLEAWRSSTRKMSCEQQLQRKLQAQMEQKVALALEVKRLKMQEVESLKQELIELHALALKDTARPSISSTPQILGPSGRYYHASGERRAESGNLESGEQ